MSSTRDEPPPDIGSSFLPQDRVADFAKMNPITVLKQTILAAGDSRLTGWHEDLIKKGEEAKIMDQVRSSDSNPCC